MATFLSPIGWADPFRDLRRFQDDLNRLFDRRLIEPRSHDFPLLNLWANEDGVVLSAELPGVVADQIQLSVHENTLTLTGRRDPVAAGEGATALRRELPAGTFTRTVVLPFVVDANQVSAKSEDGVLVVHLPRPDSDRPKRIRIATA